MSTRSRSVGMNELGPLFVKASNLEVEFDGIEKKRPCKNGKQGQTWFLACRARTVAFFGVGSCRDQANESRVLDDGGVHTAKLSWMHPSRVLPLCESIALDISEEIQRRIYTIPYSISANTGGK